MLAKIKNLFVRKLADLTAAVMAQPKIQRMLDESIKRNVASNQHLQQLLEDPEMAKLIWKSANVRPTSEDAHWIAVPNSIRESRMRQATKEAGEFIQRHIPHLVGQPSAYDTLSYALEAVKLEGLYLEFGVFSGATINHIAQKMAPETIHGFDSFEGLPESWGSLAKGTFDTGGNFPQVENNVRLHQGWFEQTIPSFLEQHSGAVAFVHADADLYSSTQTILNGLAHRMGPGTVIVFDEFINYPFWKENEYRAFTEFVERFEVNFDYIAYTDPGYSVAIRINSINSQA